MRVAVITGTREPLGADGAEAVRFVVDWATHVIVGDASGVDEVAREHAESAGAAVTLEVFRADWDTHGKAAGPLRNQAMVDRAAELAPDARAVRGYGFPSQRSRGTWDCLQRIAAAGIRSKVIPVNVERR